MHESDLDVVSLISNISDEDRATFSSSLNSNVGVRTNYHRVEYDTSWIDVFEDTIRYIDNILRNPKRFIINEEEVVLVEKSKKVTVESVIHLSQHTNLISDFNEETGDIKPSKILNILKEETLDTYENRFIYTLIQNMLNFINVYGSNMDDDSHLASMKTLSYDAKTKKGGEDISIHLELNSSENKDLNKLVNGLTVKQRIENLKEKVTDFTGSELYKDLARMHAPIVRSPIKKTNVILKNPNFQRAEALWNYMERFDKDVKREVKYNRSLSDTHNAKSKMDLAFLIDYKVLEGVSTNKDIAIDWDQINLDILKNSIKNYLDEDPYLEENKFLSLVKREFKVVRKEQHARLNKIGKIIEKDIASFDKKINAVLNTLNNI